MIQSVDRAVRILLALQEERLLGVTDLAVRLELAKGTVHGLLRTLADRSMVEQDSVSGKYSLGPALLVMGNVYLDSHELRVRSRRWVASLSESTGLAVRVGVLVWPQVVVVHHVTAPDTAVPVSEVGFELPAHATALGKAALAYHVDRRELLGGATFARLTGQTMVEGDALLEELDRVRPDGMAFERQEAVVGEVGLAGAVFSSGGRVVGAIGVVLASSESDPGEAVYTAVRDTARGISRELGNVSWPPI